MICDEIAFGRDSESSNPAQEILAALRPGLVSIPGAILVTISTPYSRSGPLWTAFARHHGKDGSDVLTIQAPTRRLNSSVPQSVVDRALEEDPEAASAEYLGLFRRDLEAFVSREVVESCIVAGRAELPPLSHLRYVGFCDPSGGSQDSMTLAIAHAEGEGDVRRAVLDCVREVRPPFSPDQVTADFAALLASYRVHQIEGDRYAGEWPRERFRVHGIDYKPAERTKSDLFREALPLFNAQRVELLALAHLRGQLLGLERRTSRGGRDSIDHAPGAHDDVANAACGALVSVLARPRVLSPAAFFCVEAYAQ